MPTGVYHLTVHLPELITNPSGTIVIDGLISGDDVLYDPAGPTPIQVEATTTFASIEVPGSIPIGGTPTLHFTAGSAIDTYSVTGASSSSTGTPGHYFDINVPSLGPFGPLTYHQLNLPFLAFSTHISPMFPISWNGLDSTDLYLSAPVDLEGTLTISPMRRGMVVGVIAMGAGRIVGG